METEEPKPETPEPVAKKERPTKKKNTPSKKVERKPEPVAEPEPMPQPEPVAEPEPMPQPEPVAEPEPMPEPEPVAEPEPMPELEPVAEPEPMPEPEPVVEPEPMPEPEPAVEAEPVVDNENMDMRPEPVEAPEEPQENAEEENNTNQDNPFQNTDEFKVDTTVSNELNSGSDGDDLTRKLLKELESKIADEKEQQRLVEIVNPVSAPSYDNIGRGLVYNCKGKHWACVEVKTFDQCRQNYSWNKQSRVSIECYPFAQLDSEFDCTTIQQEKIDSVGDTSFCGE